MSEPSTPPTPGTNWTVPQPPIVQTQPTELLWHNISDDQLGMLADMRREHLWEGMWGAIGAALGAASGAFTGLFDRYFAEPAVPLSGGDLVQVIIFFIGAALAGVLCWIVSRRGKSAKNLVTEIRQRTKHSVTG